jgi:hypothetical protein
MIVYDPSSSPLIALAEKCRREGIKSVPVWWNRGAYCLFCGCSVLFNSSEPHVCPDRVTKTFETA